MKLPSILKGFNLFLNGEDLFGSVAEVTLPKIARKIEDWIAGGFDSAIGIDMGGEPLEMEVNFGGLLVEGLKLMGASLNGVQMRFQGALQRENEDTFDEWRVSVRGRFVDSDTGGHKQGDKNEHKFKFRPTYVKMEVNGESIVEIDILAQKFITGGVDRLEGMRKALGR